MIAVNVESVRETKEGKTFNMVLQVLESYSASPKKLIICCRQRANKES